MQQHNSGAKLQHETLKWGDPGLIELTRAKKRARGTCSPGSEDSVDCYNGTGAGDDCWNVGNSANDTCGIGNSAIGYGCSIGNSVSCGAGVAV